MIKGYMTLLLHVFNLTVVFSAQFEPEIQYDHTPPKTTKVKNEEMDNSRPLYLVKDVSDKSNVQSMDNSCIFMNNHLKNLKINAKQTCSNEQNFFNVLKTDSVICKSINLLLATLWGKSVTEEDSEAIRETYEISRVLASEVKHERWNDIKDQINIALERFTKVHLSEEIELLKCFNFENADSKYSHVLESNTIRFNVLRWHCVRLSERHNECVPDKIVQPEVFNEYKNTRKIILFKMAFIWAEMSRSIGICIDNEGTDRKYEDILETLSVIASNLVITPIK